MFALSLSLISRPRGPGGQPQQAVALWLLQHWLKRTTLTVSQSVYWKIADILGPLSLSLSLSGELNNNNNDKSNRIDLKRPVEGENPRGLLLSSSRHDDGGISDSLSWLTFAIPTQMRGRGEGANCSFLVATMIDKECWAGEKNDWNLWQMGH